MLVLHYAPRTRAHRIRWLLEELGMPHELRRGTYQPPAGETFVQATPTGKFPVLEDGDVVVGESGAILLYVLERHGGGRLAPPVGSPERASFLEWVFFAEATAFPPIVNLVWHGRQAKRGEPLPALRDASLRRAHGALTTVEHRLSDRPYLVGDELTGADVMMGFTLVAPNSLGLLGDEWPNLRAYLQRLEARPAFQRAFAH
jgi:glutathione S-transferase